MNRAVSTKCPFGKGSYQKIEGNVDWLTTLPEPPATFIRADVPDCALAAFDTLAATPMIEYAEKEQTSYGGSSTRWRYQLAEWTAQTVSEIQDNRDTICSCGHSGISNCGSHYECGYDGCDERFSRADLEVDG